MFFCWWSFVSFMRYRCNGDQRQNVLLPNQPWIPVQYLYQMLSNGLMQKSIERALGRNLKICNICSTTGLAELKVMTCNCHSIRSLVSMLCHTFYSRSFLLSFACFLHSFHVFHPFSFFLSRIILKAIRWPKHLERLQDLGNWVRWVA